MNVGLLTTSYPRFAGDTAGCFVEGFARTLVGLGHSVEVICPEPHAPSSRPTVAGVTVVEVPYLRPRVLERTFYGSGVPDNVRMRPWVAAGLPTYLAALSAAVRRRERRWDGLVSHWAVPSGLVAAEHAQGRPHLAVFHSADVHLLARLPAQRAIARRMLRGTSALWFVSTDLQERFAHIAGPPDGQRPTHVAPMGFTPGEPLMEPRESVRARLGVSGFTALTLARLVPIKGLDDAIRAAKHVPGVELVLAGTGPERARLVELTQLLGAPVQLVGQVTGLRKQAWLAAADVFVLPSIESAAGRCEGAPTAVLEAMAAGLPVIATHTGGLPELVRHGEHGLLVPPRSPEALARALGQLRDDRRLRERLGRAARERAAGFAWSGQRAALAELLAPRSG